jgi:hypothetical protein
MKNQIKVVDGFVWFIVTNKAKQIFESRLFELYVLHDDGSESLIHTEDFLRMALVSGSDIGIEVGFLPEEN